MPDPIHAHCFLPGIDTTGVPLVLLHGSGGNECDLLSLASELAPNAPKLGIRGSVAIEGGYAFFQRFPDRRADQADIAAKAPVLAAFIEASRARYNFSGRPIAIGFSNGAIMAAALLLAHPGLLAGAILFRPLSPFTHDSRTDWTIRRCRSSTLRRTVADRPPMACDWRIGDPSCAVGRPRDDRRGQANCA